MRSPLIIVTGTGTGIGKTHAAETLLRRWALSARVCGIKPIETGVLDGHVGDDAHRLENASTFHVKHQGTTFAAPISPHLAARAAGVVLTSPPIVRVVQELREQAEGVLVELAGGLFSPLGPRFTNADLARDLGPARVVLVAPDRLGVLHDLGSATRAARAEGVEIHGILLMAPPEPDASTGLNAAEVGIVTDVPLLASLPRDDAAALARRGDVESALFALTR